MSVIVKGMKMPKNCTHCDYIGLNVAIGCPVMTGINGRATDCPLVELPEYHGRLIDVDNLEPDADYDDGEYWAYSIRQVYDVSTIFEPEYTEEDDEY